MPRAVDLGSTQSLDLSHDPTKQMSADTGLMKNVGALGDQILQIPKLIIQAILSAGAGIAIGVGTAITTALNMLTSWANIIKSVLSGVIPTVEAGLESWFSDDGPFGGILGFFGVLRTVPDKITEHTEAIARLNDISASMHTTVAYVGDMQDMVTVPRSQLWAWAPNTFKSVSYGGWTIADSVYDLDPTPTTFIPGTTGYPGSSTGQIFYTPIVVDRKGIPDKIRWIVGTDTSIFSISYYEIALCVYDPTDGKIKKVWGSGDIKDAEASTTTVYEAEIDMGLDTEENPQIVSPGQILFAAHQQIANGFGQSARRVCASPQGNVGRPSTMLLNSAHFRTDMYSKGIPSEIALSSLTGGNGFIPWFAVSVKALPEPEETL